MGCRQATATIYGDHPHVIVFTYHVQAWRFLLQLRWVRRRIDAARHAACKGSASVASMSQRDEAERAAVAAAQTASNQSGPRRLWYGSGTQRGVRAVTNQEMIGKDVIACSLLECCCLLCL